jgi:hypothetical protein
VEHPEGVLLRALLAEVRVQQLHQGAGVVVSPYLKKEQE